MEFEFTDLDLTAFGGASILAQTARRLGLFDLLGEAVSVKVRNRGASDAQTLWAIIASLARGQGSLSDLDALRADRVASALLGLRKVPEARRAGEWLARLRPADVKGLWRVAVEFAGRVAPSVVDHEVGTKGYVPLFIDATGIEVDGRLFQWSGKDYHGNRGYWLHATFLGGLWSAGQLQPGGGRVTLNWRRLLEWTAGMLPAGTPVWLRADNAYYKGDLVRLCAERGWDFSISLTNDLWRGPVLEQLEGLPDSAWTDIGMEEEATFATHRPRGWEREQHYVVVRRRTEGGQLLLVPRHTVVLVSRNDLPLKELVVRHRAKQGQENAFKGPLTDLGLPPPAVPVLPGQPGLLRPGPHRPGPASGGAVHGAAEGCAAPRHPPGHPLRDAHRGAHGPHGAPDLPALRQDQLPAGLALRGHDRLGGGARTAAPSAGLTPHAARRRPAAGPRPRPSRNRPSRKRDPASFRNATPFRRAPAWPA